MKVERNSRFSEAELVLTLTAWLCTSGYRVRHEVSNMGQSADLVAIRGRWVTIFEAKLGDWRRALQQCEAHEPVADYICVAVASATINETLRSEVTKRGYGLVHYRSTDRQLHWVCKPVRNAQVWQPQRRVWSDSVRKVAYAN